MTAATVQREPAADEAPWFDTVHRVLKRSDVRLVAYVPDKVFTPLIERVHTDSFFIAFAATREEEAVGILTGAWMGGVRGCLLMQTSGFATITNALASLAVPYQIPLVMFVSERGTLGEFNLVQTYPAKTMRPVLDALAVTHHTIARAGEVEFITERSIRQAFTTQAPVALILSPLLTGGKAG